MLSIPPQGLTEPQVNLQSFATLLNEFSTAMQRLRCARDAGRNIRQPRKKKSFAFSGKPGKIGENNRRHERGEVSESPLREGNEAGLGLLDGAIVLDDAHEVHEALAHGGQLRRIEEGRLR